MLITIPDQKKRSLLKEGFLKAIEFKDGARPVWPDDPPAEKNRVVVVPVDPAKAKQIYATSARVITIGRELSGGMMGDKYGIVCAADDRNKTQFVVGGGKVQPDFDTNDSSRLHDEDREFVRGAAVAENREELKIIFSDNDPDAFPRYVLFGVRLITDYVVDAEGKRGTVVVQKEGIDCADVCFMTVTNERLGHFDGQKGETRTRTVLPVSTLLRDLSREERTRGDLRMLPLAQATVLAMAIIYLNEVFGKELPPALAEVVEEGLQSAIQVASRSPYAEHFTRVIQEGGWEV